MGQESISFDLIAGPATKDGLPCQAAIMKPKVLLSVQIQSKKAKMTVKVISYLQAWPEGFELWTTGQTTLARTVKAGLGLHVFLATLFRVTNCAG